MQNGNRFSSQKLKDEVKEALEQWHDNSTIITSLSYLYLYHILQQEKNTENARQLTNQILLHGLEILETENEQQAEVLLMRFRDRQTAYAVANYLSIADSTVYLIQRQAIERLTEILYNLELQARTSHRFAMEKRLEAPSYTNLIGVEQHLEQLLDLLAAPKPPWLIAIEGIGGIGKTSLANALARNAIEQLAFQHFGWVTLQQTKFHLNGQIKSVNTPIFTTADLVEMLIEKLFDSCGSDSLSVGQKIDFLQTHLKQTAYLIVIDNLETLAEIDALSALLPQLINPTKFLLTSRERFYSEPNVYHFTMSELSELEAFQLMRQEAILSNLSHLASASNDELHPIYETVGGNPLALRLVVNQANTYGLSEILHELVTARGEKADMLYKYIYWHIWNNLDQESRRVLLAMPSTLDNSGALTSLSTVTGLDIHQLHKALDTLIEVNLINFSGNLDNRQSTIHNLTRTFVQEPIVEWQ